MDADEGGATTPAVIEAQQVWRNPIISPICASVRSSFVGSICICTRFPRVLGLVLGNSCNIDCRHCYQAKNGDNLLKPAAIGDELRREFRAFYPYLSTLRVQGGEAFAYPGFAALIEDVGENGPAAHP